MRIRTIKPSFFKNDELAGLPPLTRILYQGLWCLADSRGRLEDRPIRIKAEVLPYDAWDIDKALSSLSPRFITRYEVDGKKLIEVNGFNEHQRITGKEAETPSDYPAATGENRVNQANCARGNNGETTGKQSGNNGETVVAQEGKGRERKGKEGNESAHANVDEMDLISGNPDQKSMKTTENDWQMIERSLPWARELIKKGCKIGKNNWTQWKEIVDNFSLESVVSAACGVPAIERWADNVEESLIKSRGQANPGDVIASKIIRMTL